MLKSKEYLSSSECVAFIAGVLLLNPNARCEIKDAPADGVWVFWVEVVPA